MAASNPTPATSAAVQRIGSRVVVASISGGKDSAAMALYLRELGIEHRRVFMDTGWEHPQTYDYLRGELTRVLGPIEEIRGPRNFEELVRHKGMFPSRVRRFCTTELKVKPMRDWLRTLDAPAVNAVGIRAVESAARSKMSEWEDIDPEVWIWRPLIAWTLDDVIEIHQRHGLRPNPLYLAGAQRVGCWPCIHARKAELRLVADTDPSRIDRLRVLERDVEHKARERYEARGETIEGRGHFVPTFFVGRTPDSRGSRFLPIDDAVEWARSNHDDRTLEMFPDDAADAGCMRWGMCDLPSEEVKAS